MERTRVWHGTVKPEARDEHERFVAWLGSDEAATQFSKFLLTTYQLVEQGDELTVTMGAEEPPALIRFLRNGRMWPEFWEFKPAEAGAGPSAGVERVRWRRAGA